MSSTLALLGPGSPLLLAAHQHTFSVSFSSTTIQAILALIAGVLVIIRPKNLNAIIAGYLIALGIVQLFQFSF